VKHSELFFGALRVPVDFLAVIAAFFAARTIRLHPTFFADFQSPAGVNLDFAGFSKFVTLAALALIGIFAINRLYQMRDSIGFGKESRQIVLSVSVWLLLIIAYFFFRREFFFSRLALAYTGVFTIFFVSFGRITIQQLRKLFWHFGVGVTKILVVGTNSNSLALANILQKNPRYRFVGFIESGEKINSKFPHKSLGTFTNLEKIVKKECIEEVVLASHKFTHNDMRQLLTFCRTNHLDFRFMPDLVGVPQKNVDVETIQGIPLISLRPTPLTSWGRIIKRIFDFGIGLSVLILTIPIWLITAIIIKLDSSGPIFFLRKDDGSMVLRVGKQGLLFPFIKFRSMRTKTDSLRYSEKLIKKNSRGGTPLVKLKDDPRITRVGKFIRKYSIDELPQLLSVIRGDMSLVGPRPHLPEEVANYKPRHRRVLTIKPGMTGLAQVSGRSDLNFEEEVAFDTWYIENWSIWLDLKILWRTIGVVLFPKHQE